MTSPRSAPRRPETRAGNGGRKWFSILDQRVVAEGPIRGMAGWFPRPGLGSAGSDLRAQGSSKEERRSRCARGMGWIASNACSGPVPLPPGLPAGANLPPITPRPSLPSREPWLLTGQDHGQGGRIYTDRVSQIRKSFPDPVPSPSSGFLREALPDLHEKFAATGRVASLLAC
jgi:hypothetical protein